MRRVAFALLAVLSFAVVALSARAEGEDQTISLADGKIVLKAPAGWKKQAPKTNIVEYEFSAPAVEGDDKDARITVMGAGGGVEANIERWVGQFSQPDGQPTSDRTFKDKTTVNGVEIHVVDINGTYKDQAGPFAPATQRDDYRMIAGIVATEKNGDYFIKMYGPKKTIEAQAEAFKKMMKEVEVK